MNLEEKTTKNSGNNSGPRQGGGTPSSGNMSTPLRQDVRTTQVNSVPNKGRQSSGMNYQATVNRIRNQEVRRGNLRTQRTAQVQSRKQDFEATQVVTMVKK
jgi:hypothetical protein